MNLVVSSVQRPSELELDEVAQRTERIDEELLERGVRWRGKSEDGELGEVAKVGNDRGEGNKLIVQGGSSSLAASIASNDMWRSRVPSKPLLNSKSSNLTVR